MFHTQTGGKYFEDFRILRLSAETGLYSGFYGVIKSVLHHTIFRPWSKRGDQECLYSGVCFSFKWTIDVWQFVEAPSGAVLISYRVGNKYELKSWVLQCSLRTDVETMSITTKLQCCTVSIKFFTSPETLQWYSYLLVVLLRSMLRQRLRECSVGIRSGGNILQLQPFCGHFHSIKSSHLT